MSLALGLGVIVNRAKYPHKPQHLKTCLKRLNNDTVVQIKSIHTNKMQFQTALQQLKITCPN